MYLLESYHFRHSERNLKQTKDALLISQLSVVIQTDQIGIYIVMKNLLSLGICILVVFHGL